MKLDEFQLPKISEILSILILGSNKIFFGIDLKCVVFQVELENKDRHKAAFLDCKQRPMQFTRMPQGFKNRPAIFQRGLSLILSDLIGKCCYCYIDDIIIFSKDKLEHAKNTQEVLDELKRHGMEINESKSVYNNESVKFLGHKVSYNKTQASHVRSQGIIEFTTLKSKREVRKFIGLINYDRMFVKGLSIILKPLYGKITAKEFF